MALAIKAEHVLKEYRLGVINHGMLYKDIQSGIAHILGKPDPHSKIGNQGYSGKDDRFLALDNLCFEIEQGDRVGIIGRNGAGKSTLLKVLARITAPTSGIAKIKGRISSLLEVGTGFHPELTGRENVYLNGAILGMKKWEIDKKFDEIVDFSEIEKFIDTPVKRYSSGMFVRLAFSVAVHLNSDILLADEVLAVGDAVFQRKSINKMNDISINEGKTVIFVSHNLGFISRLCTNAMYLEKGSLIDFGLTNDVIEKYTASQSNFSNKLTVSDNAGCITVNMGIISIDEVKFYSERDEDFVFESEPILATIIFSSSKNIERLWFGLNITTINGDILSNIYSTDLGEYFNIDSGKYKLNFVISNTLKAGSFIVSVGSTIGTNTVFIAHNGMRLEIMPSIEGDFSISRDGSVNLSSTWGKPIKIDC